VAFFAGKQGDLRVRWEKMASGAREFRKRSWRAVSPKRAGAATLDYVLILGVILPLAAFMMWVGPRVMNLVYEMTCVLISWPFL